MRSLRGHSTGRGSGWGRRWGSGRLGAFICSHYYRIVLGLVLFGSAAAELLGSVAEVRHGLSVGVLVFGLFQMLVATAGVAEGVERTQSGWMGDLIRSKWGEFAVGLFLFAGSSFALLRADTEMFSSLSVHHGALAVGFFSALSALAHLTIGAQKLAENSRWLSHPATEVAVAILLVIATFGELEVEKLGSMPLHSAHGLFLFGIGRVIEIAAHECVSDTEDNQQASSD